MPTATSSSHNYTHMRTHILLVIAVLLLLCASANRSQATSVEDSAFERAEIKDIRGNLREIMAEPEFARKKTFMQWLGEKLSKWDRPDFDFSPLWGTVLIWILLGWCILTLIAILIHFAWTAYVLIRSNNVDGTAAKTSEIEALMSRSPEKLFELAQQLADKGQFAEAIGIMMAATIKRLDHLRILRFHESKTNGDYLSEYPRGTAGQKGFKDTVLLFDNTIYGGLEVGGNVYNKFKSLFEEIIGVVS